ncbi:hypothetical protein NXT08_24700 (plasmid) [Rhodococcus pyridinivorans]|uniref:DUF6884 domain-containing protein n=1 Tax=Rhodococcus pyridinivorans TaxID=103816 RepID=UPI0021643D24|nr:DUF6884 domain-containing protein [Rhodococcus pyridinivorans]UVT27701.1 hypothetical protein NXT08_24700 [Rhodococcus pyridinivorans]
MAHWDVLIDKLVVADTPVRLTWEELESLVGDLPTSAVRHRTWWWGDRGHVNAWKAAGFVLTDLRLGETVTFDRITTPGHPSGVVTADGPGPTATAGERSDGHVEADLVLVTCVKSKREAPSAAKDLYVSPLFTKQRAYAEQTGRLWFILSAEHGLVAPDDWLAPYERYLPDTPPAYRAAWGRWVAERLELLAGPLEDRVVEIHAGATYLDALAPHLHAKGASIRTPLAGLSMGRRLSWYTQHGSDTPAAEPTPVADGGATHADTAAFVDGLLDHTHAVRPTQFLAADPAQWKRPGLYSWWVDAVGADDLTIGLDLPIAPGLIYAGLAGATRWPSGKRSSNTLWSRIAGMHLGGKHEFSTFRRTLGSILAHAQGSDVIDETALTAWMTRHLTVVAIASADPDTLGRLEDEVLAAIDPPLNLQGMAPTPVRIRLKELRRRHR